MIFAIVSIALFMSSVDSTIVSTALPTLRQALHARLNWASWAITGYQLGLVVAMPLMGRVGDQFGRRRVFVTAAVVFTSASLACGLSGNIEELVGLRVVQALASGAFVPCASGILADSFGADRDRAIGLTSGVFPFGALAGPVVGGVLLAAWSWRAIFFVNVPIGIAFTALAIRYLPRSRPVGGGEADWRGALVLGGVVLAFMLAISRLGDRQVSLLAPGFLAAVAATVALGWWFVRRASRVSHPLVPPHLLKDRSFLLMNLINAIWGAAVIGVASLVPLLAEQAYGFKPLEAGTLLTTRALAEMAIAVIAAMCIARTGYRVPMAVGFLLICAGLVMLAWHDPVGSPYAWLVVATGLTGLGTGESAPSANNATIDLSPDDVGAITGLRGAVRQMGAIAAVAVTTSFAAHSPDEGIALAHAFIGLAALLALMLPVIGFAVPAGAGIGAREPLFSE